MNGLTTLRFSGAARRLAVLCALCVPAPAAFGQSIGLALGSATGQPGGSVSVPLSLTTSGAQVSSISWTFAYAAADISNVSVAPGPAATAAAKSISCQETSTGRSTCVAFGLNRNLIANGVLANATFTLAANTSATTTSIQNLNPGAASANGDAVLGTGSAGAIAITRPVSLSAIACSPAALVAPASSQCTVSLTAAASSSGVAVSLGYSASGASISMPANLTVPSGSTTSRFTLQATSATRVTSVQVSATAAGLTKTASVTVSPAATTPVISVAVSPTSATLTAGGTRQFTATVSGTSNTGVTWSLSPAVGTISSTGLYRAPSAVTAPQTITVRAMSVAAATTFATATVTVNPVAAPPPTTTLYSVFPAAVTPTTLADSDSKAVELGMKFSSTVNGFITGVRFYKGSSQNRGQHVANLWTTSGQRLATAVFTNETSSGWQQVNFAEPVAVKANTVYVVSYFAPNGRYASTTNYFGSAIGASPFWIPSGAGVYRYGSSSRLPSESYRNSNYWVDVIFKR